MPAFTNANRLTPQSSRAPHFTRYYLGRVELDEKQYAASVHDLEYASELWPEDPEFLLTLAAAEVTLHGEGRTGTALAKAGTLRLNDAQTVRYGSLLLANEPDHGIEVFRRLATEHGDGAPWTEFDLAVAFLVVHRPADAIPYAERLTHSESSLQASAWMLLGIAEARKPIATRQPEVYTTLNMGEQAAGAALSSDLTFLTNEAGKTLRDRFGVLLTDDTRFFDCLVGYFFISGFYKLYPALEKVEKIRVLVGLKTDRTVYDLLQEAKEHAPAN